MGDVSVKKTEKQKSVAYTDLFIVPAFFPPHMWHMLRMYDVNEKLIVFDSDLLNIAF